MLGKLIFLSVLVCIFALFVNIEITSKYLHENVFPKMLQLLPGFPIFDMGSNASMSEKRSGKVFSQDELLKFKGIDGSKVYLAIVGHVYDVTKGKRHYGPGGGYEFFAGIDGSKAYVTGDFNKEGLTDDISTLKPAEILALEEWKSFYEKDYAYVGLVDGAFFDKDGNERPLIEEYRKKLELARNEKNLIEKDRQLFPPCNSEWSQNNGGRLWCSTLSGGISRDWVGVPRLYYTAGSSKPRCACVRTTGPPSHDIKSKDHKNRGDLDNPNLNVYPNCSPYADSCPLPDN